MATPIRLLFGNNNAIQLNAQTLDISVDRKVSTFPTPGAILERFAIDTNTPAIGIEISGILTDDDVNNLNQSVEVSAPALGVISLSNFVPTTISQGNTNIIDEPRVRAHSQMLGFTDPMENFIVKEAYNKGQSSTIKVRNKSYITASNVRLFLYGGGIARLKSDVSSVTQFVVIKVTGNFMNRDIKAGDILVNADNGALIGVVGSVGAIDENDEYTVTLSTSAVTLTAFTVIGIRRKIYNRDGDEIGTVESSDPNIVTTSKTWNNSTKSYTGDDSNPVQVNHPSGLGNVYAVGTTAAIPVKTRTATEVIYVGTMLYNSDNARIGKVTAVTGTSVTIGGGTLEEIIHDEHFFVQNNSNNSSYQAISQLRLSSGNSVSLEENEKIYIGAHPPIENELDGEYLLLVPSYWQEGTTRSPARRKLKVGYLGSKYRTQGIRLEFDASVAHTLFGGSACSVIKTAGQATRSSYATGRKYYADSADAVIRIPVKNLTTSTRYGNEDYPNLSQDPSHNLALILKEAIELTTDITYGTAQTAPGSQTVAGAFSADVSNGTILIRQKYTPARELNFYDILSETNISFAADFSTNSAVKGGKKSAGDKVQDLLGLMSNARKGADLFRGIQIPYQSLITSNNVTGSARNFFLTFGDIPLSEKGAITNTRDASKYMEDIITQDGGSVQEETAPSKVEKILSDTFPNIHAFGEFLIGTLETIYVTLTADAHGNQGGIRIIPEKFHVRYDAGNKYYAYSLKLKASDFVIGV